MFANAASSTASGAQVLKEPVFFRSQIEFFLMTEKKNLVNSVIKKILVNSVMKKKRKKFSSIRS